MARVSSSQLILGVMLVASTAAPFSVKEAYNAGKESLCAQVRKVQPVCERVTSAGAYAVSRVADAGKNAATSACNGVVAGARGVAAVGSKAVNTVREHKKKAAVCAAATVVTGLAVAYALRDNNWERMVAYVQGRVNTLDANARAQWAALVARSSTPSVDNPSSPVAQVPEVRLETSAQTAAQANVAPLAQRAEQSLEEVAKAFAEKVQQKAKIAKEEAAAFAQEVRQKMQELWKEHAASHGA